MSFRNIAIKVEEELFKKVKIKVAKEGITLRDYVIKLIEQDLEKDKE